MMDHQPGDIPVLCCMSGVVRLSAAHIATVSRRLSSHIDHCPSRGELAGRSTTIAKPPTPNMKKRSNVNRELKCNFPTETDRTVPVRSALINRLSAVMPALEESEIRQWTIRRDPSFAPLPIEQPRTAPPQDDFVIQPSSPVQWQPAGEPPPPALEWDDANVNARHDPENGQSPTAAPDEFNSPHGVCLWDLIFLEH
jgi:hypothetical protein